MRYFDQKVAAKCTPFSLLQLFPQTNSHAKRIFLLIFIYFACLIVFLSIPLLLFVFVYVFFSGLVAILFHSVRLASFSVDFCRLCFIVTALNSEYYSNGNGSFDTILFSNIGDKQIVDQIFVELSLSTKYFQRSNEICALIQFAAIISWKTL